MYCTNPKVAGSEAQYLAGNIPGVLAEFERKKRFFGKCGREGKLFEPIPAPAAD
jgi:hypothetical protein